MRMSSGMARPPPDTVLTIFIIRHWRGIAAFGHSASQHKALRTEHCTDMFPFSDRMHRCHGRAPIGGKTCSRFMSSMHRLSRCVLQSSFVDSGLLLPGSDDHASSQSHVANLTALLFPHSIPVDGQGLRTERDYEVLSHPRAVCCGCDGAATVCGWVRVGFAVGGLCS